MLCRLQCLVKPGVVLSSVYGYTRCCAKCVVILGVVPSSVHCYTRCCAEFSVLLYKALCRVQCMIIPDVVPSSVYGCTCLLYTSPSPRDMTISRMPSSA